MARPPGVKDGRPQAKRKAQHAKTGPKGPMKFDSECIAKLKAAFSNYANIQEACRYANISVDTFYYNAPAGSELYAELLSWRMQPALKAKQVVLSSIGGGNSRDAWEWLRTTKSDEFSEKTRVEKDVTVRNALDEKTAEIYKELGLDEEDLSSTAS